MGFNGRAPSGRARDPYCPAILPGMRTPSGAWDKLHGNHPRHRRRRFHRLQLRAARARGDAAPASSCSTSSPTPAASRTWPTCWATPTWSSSRGTSPTAPPCAGCSPRSAPRRSSTSPPRATSTARSTTPAPSSRPTSSAPSSCWRRPGIISRTLGRGGAARLPLPPRLHRRGLRQPRAHRRASPRRPPYAPNSPYSASKAAADHLVRAYHETYGLPALLTNCSNNYGPYQFPEKLIPLMVLNALDGRPLPIYGDGGNVRDWIHVEDHCRGVLEVLRRGRPGREVQPRRPQRADQPADRRRDLRHPGERAAGGRQPRPRRARHPAYRELRSSSPTAPATTAATRSTTPRSSASSAGRRARASRRGCAPPCAGTSATAPGARRCRPAATAASGSAWAAESNVESEVQAG